MAEERDDGLNVEEALLGSVPARPALTPEELAELAAMATNARTASAPSRIHGRLSRGAAVGLAAVVVGGIGAAAALTGLGSEPRWMAEPDAEMTFEIPGGQVCEVIVGHQDWDDPELESAVQDFYESADLADLIDVEAVIDAARQNAPGDSVEAEMNYQRAVTSEILRELNEELKQHGYTAEQLNELGPIASSDCDEAP